MSQAEVDALINKYKLPSGLINYSDFCKNIDHVFSDAADPNSVIQNAKSSANFSEEEMGTLIAILAAIRE